jgi:hypothetical protein
MKFYHSKFMQPILPHSTRNLMTSKKNQQSEPTKPKILLIGTSNIKGIDEERLSAKFVTHRCTAYTFR